MGATGLRPSQAGGVRKARSELVVLPRPRRAATKQVLGPPNSLPSGTSLAQRPGEPIGALTFTSLSSTSSSALDLGTVLLAPTILSSTTSSLNALVNALNAPDLNVCKADAEIF